ncbi:MAG: JAB domain-containing protein [Syntrophales bacterium]
MSNFNQASQFWEDLRTGKFAQMVKEESKGKEISGAAAAYHILKPLFAESNDVEVVYCIFLDGQNHVMAIEKMFSGTINHATVFPRELVKRVLALKASAVLMAHNHPSGNTHPSAEDKAITWRIIFSLMTIDVLLHDHLIVGDGYSSLSDEEWMRTAKDQCQRFLAQPF